MSDLEEFYKHADECLKTLSEAFAFMPEHAMIVSRAKRCLARATTAYGEPAVPHERRVRLCRSAKEALEQAILNFETDAPLNELVSGIGKANRRLLKVAEAHL